MGQAGVCCSLHYDPARQGIVEEIRWGIKENIYPEGGTYDPALGSSFTRT